jgi:phosphotransferase system HPr-like phosphotransfer protein
MCESCWHALRSVAVAQQHTMAVLAVSSDGQDVLENLLELLAHFTCFGGE